MTALSGWENFYVIIGSSAGALIGLQFVVLTLIANRPVRPDTVHAGNAFATPTIVHFGVVLLLAGIFCAPWHNIKSAAIVWGLFGSTGVAYSVIVARRMKRQKVYAVVFEDWLFHFLLPFAAYVLLAGSSLAAGSRPHETLFVVATSALLLLFIGIHNAWDGITYHVYTGKASGSQSSSNP